MATNGKRITASHLTMFFSRTQCNALTFLKASTPFFFFNSKCLLCSVYTRYKRYALM